MTVQAAGGCGDTWTADVQVRAYGRDAATITRVTASAAGGSVVLAGGDGSWAGELAGLPGGPHRSP